VTEPALVPEPVELASPGEGYLLTPDTVVACDGEAREVAGLLREYLAVTGLPLPVRVDDRPGGIELRLAGAAGSGGGEGQEGYQLTSGPEGVRIEAGTPAGLRHGVQTLRQLLPPEVFGTTPAAGVTWAVPGVRVVDQPRFAWRGSHLDVGRHFMPLDFLHRYVELLAQHKLNRLHLHLTEDQGWRFEVKRYPRLTEVGAWRAESDRGLAGTGDYDGTPHGGWYSQDELRELAAFADRRGVVIVPEVDLPGHVTAALAAYPELGVDGRPHEVARDWGIFTSVLNIEESTMAFVEQVLEELLDVFPSPFIHIGGDECPTTEWEGDPRVDERMRELGIDDASGIQPWFTRRMCAFLLERGRRPVVWDEAATPALDPRAVVMAWRGSDRGADAVARGWDVVMAPQERTYFDWYADDSPGQPVAQPWVTTVRQVVEWDPDVEAVDGSDGPRGRVLGTQGQLWTEFMPTPQRVEEMAFPRLSALAERAWSPAPGEGAWEDFAVRLAVHQGRLDAQGVHRSVDNGSTGRG
jgi:hexosaminidase